mmetsp:Transcript_49248/g.154719  ORF Transcript_49248/g.154719 Transcript_49248/m.154719 type:complete len:619 (-) Transcript_49248:157-2013(-)
MEAWSGTWAVDRRENWEPWMKFMGVPPDKYDAAKTAPDFHKYRMASSRFTMEHIIPAQSLHLLFCADLDGSWLPSPYTKPTVAHWAEGDMPKIAQFRNMWLEEPTAFRTEYPDWMGREGKTMRLDRRLVSGDLLEMTVHILEGEDGAAIVGPCTTIMRRVSDVGPEPVAWLRKCGRPLKTAEARKEALDQLRSLVMENVDALSSAHESDRVFPSKFNGVAGMLAHGLQAYRDHVEAFMAPEVLADRSPPMLRAGVDAEYSVVKEPLGVCINISPWNAPVQLSLMPVMAMLAAGNHAVIKPPELTPTISRMLRNLCQRYLHGFVWVEEGDREAVERLIDERADRVVFTGGGEIAKVVAARCAQHLTPVSLELGGKSPAFVDGGLTDDLLSDVVREVLQLKVVKTGQFCCAHDYLLVHETIHERFVTKLQAELEALGTGRNVRVLGRRQYDTLRRRFEAAAATAERCLPPLAAPCVFDDAELSVPATVLLEPARDCELMTCEVFGPLLPLYRVRDVADAIDRVNSSPTGKPLIAYCYSTDATSIDAFIAQTSSGNVAVNSGPQRILSNTEVSFGGVGNSGYGAVFWGQHAMSEFSNRKHVVRARSGFAKSFFSGPPPTAS